MIECCRSDSILVTLLLDSIRLTDLLNVNSFVRWFGKQFKVSYRDGVSMYEVMREVPVVVAGILPIRFSLFYLNTFMVILLRLWFLLLCFLALLLVSVGLIKLFSDGFVCNFTESFDRLFRRRCDFIVIIPKRKIGRETMETDTIIKGSCGLECWILSFEESRNMQPFRHFQWPVTKYAAYVCIN